MIIEGKLSPRHRESLSQVGLLWECVRGYTSGFFRGAQGGKRGKLRRPRKWTETGMCRKTAKSSGGAQNGVGRANTHVCPTLSNYLKAFLCLSLQISVFPFLDAGSVLILFLIHGILFLPNFGAAVSSRELPPAAGLLNHGGACGAPSTPWGRAAPQIRDALQKLK